MSRYALLLSCEHGGARVPPRYRHLFDGAPARTALGSHRGCDVGALSLARSLSGVLGAPLRASTVSRLLVDLNRSVGHPGLFSEFSMGLGAAEREELLARYYYPHRNAVESWIDRRARSRHRVVHVAVHSFTPRLAGKTRTADVGLLYDPSRTAERILCRSWKAALFEVEPALRARRNYPYLGKTDGFPTYLRRRFSEARYVGIELEVNQALLATARGRRQAARSIARSLRLVMNRR